MSMADDVVAGLVCSWCGVFFVEEHGFPVVCRDCAEVDPAVVEPRGLVVATLAELGDGDTYTDEPPTKPAEG